MTTSLRSSPTSHQHDAGKTTNYLRARYARPPDSHRARWRDKPASTALGGVGYRTEKPHHTHDGGLVCPPNPPLLRTACSASGSLTSSPLPAAECAGALSRLVSLLAGSLRAAIPLLCALRAYNEGLAALRSKSGVRSGLRPQRAFLSAGAQNCGSKTAGDPNPRARCRTSRGTTALGRRRAAGLLPSALAPCVAALLHFSQQHRRQRLRTELRRSLLSPRAPTARRFRLRTYVQRPLRARPLR